MLRLKIDLHVHVLADEGRVNVREVLEAARFKGFDGLAVTDYDCLDGYFTLRAEGSDMLLLPGYEIHTDAGHLLVLGLDRLPPISRDQRYEELVAWAKSMGGLTVLAHPIAGRIRLKRWMQCKPDAVEVLNASYPMLALFVSRGMALAAKLDVPMVGGSDAHADRPHTIGDAYTLVEADNPTPIDVIQAITDGRVGFGGGLSPLSVRLRTGFGYMVSTVGKKPRGTKPSDKC